MFLTSPDIKDTIVFEVLTMTPDPKTLINEAYDLEEAFGF